MAARTLVQDDLLGKSASPDKASPDKRSLSPRYRRTTVEASNKKQPKREASQSLDDRHRSGLSPQPTAIRMPPGPLDAESFSFERMPSKQVEVQQKKRSKHGRSGDLGDPEVQPRVAQQARGVLPLGLGSGAEAVGTLPSLTETYGLNA